MIDRKEPYNPFTIKHLHNTLQMLHPTDTFGEDYQHLYTVATIASAINADPTQREDLSAIVERDLPNLPLWESVFTTKSSTYGVTKNGVVLRFDHQNPHTKIILPTQLIGFIEQEDVETFRRDAGVMRHVLEQRQGAIIREERRMDLVGISPRLEVGKVPLDGFTGGIRWELQWDGESLGIIIPAGVLIPDFHVGRPVSIIHKQGG